MQTVLSFYQRVAWISALLAWGATIFTSFGGRFPKGHQWCDKSESDCAGSAVSSATSVSLAQKRSASSSIERPTRYRHPSMELIDCCIRVTGAETQRPCTAPAPVSLVYRRTTECICQQQSCPANPPRHMSIFEAMQPIHLVARDLLTTERSNSLSAVDS